MEKLNSEGETKLHCLNPSGTLYSHWALPLIFQFIPKTTESLEVLQLKKNTLLIKVHDVSDFITSLLRKASSCNEYQRKRIISLQTCNKRD